MAKTNAAPQIVSARKEATVTILQEVQYAVLEGTLCVYKHITASRQNSGAKKTFESLLPNRTIQGFAELKSIESFLKGQTPYISELVDFLYVDQSLLKIAQEKGYAAAANAFAEISKDNRQFSLFEKGELDLAGIVKWDFRTRMLYDRFGEVLPTAVFFNYMNGNLRNGAYDLEKVVKILSKRKGIQALQGERKLEVEKLCIDEVPYYNRRGACSAQVQFIFQPTVREMRAMWAKMQELNKRTPSIGEHLAIFELDLLGLRKGGAAKYQDYWESDSTPDTESCDDGGEDD
jgi:hypothetical protein